MAGKEKDEFFVNIEEPITLRKSVLESSRGVIHLLKDFEGLKTVRKEKSELVKNLDDVMKEISTLVTKLRTELPKVPASKIQKVKVTKPKVKKEVAPKEETKEVSHLDKLEAELDDVEKELADLQ